MAVVLPPGTKPQKVISLALPLARRSWVMPRMITWLSEDTFRFTEGDTVNVKLGELYTRSRLYDFRTRTGPIVFDDIQGGGSVPVTIGTHRYSATELRDEHMTLDNIELGRQVLAPQVNAVVNDVELDVVDAFNDLRYRNEIDFEHGDDPYLVAVEAQRIFNGYRHLIPTDGRFWVCGSNVFASIISHPRVSQASQGSNEFANSALGSAVLPGQKLGGFTVVAPPEVDPDFSAFMSQSALLGYSIPPKAPNGANYVARASKYGINVRWLMDYDSSYLTDRSIVSLLYGLAPVYDERKGGTGPDRYELKTDYVDPDVAKSFRAIKVNYTNAAGGSVLAP